MFYNGAAVGAKADLTAYASWLTVNRSTPYSARLRSRRGQWYMTLGGGAGE
ncbi:MAG: hypothetical protein MZV64_21670 [Ignavibacteriales bacterium]|nr:hypothetical protein [Ignavibacteriales bacterium]